MLEGFWGRNTLPRDHKIGARRGKRQNEDGSRDLERKVAARAKAQKEGKGTNI